MAFSVIAMLAMNYLGTCFCLLTYERGMTFSAAMNHYVFVLIVVFFLIFRFGGVVKRAQKIEAKIKAAKEAKEKQQ